MILRPIEHLLQELDEYTGLTKHALVDEAVARREEITPHLLAVLDDMASDPDEWLEDGHDIGPYAVVLLGYFGEEQAHPLLLEIMRLPDDLPYEMLSDIIGETIPGILVRTCNGSLDGIKEMILDRDASDYCRWAGCTALAYAAASGVTDRQEVVSFLSRLLTGGEAEPGSDFWNGVVDTLMELHPGETMAEIRTAFDNGLVDPTFCGFDEVEDVAAKDPDAVMADLLADFRRRAPDDIHGYIDWWYEPARKAQERVAKEAANQARAQKKKKQQRRKKSNQAKKSKRRNR